MISIVAALSSEVKGLIDHLSLRHQTSKPFAYYNHPDSEVEVLVSGIGANAMSTAVGWLAGARPCDRLWINFGIAGHLSFNVGELVLVHGCADALDGHAHYPPMLLAGEIAHSAACLSIAQASTDYPADALLDMEAHSFFSSACRFSSSEFVQSLKVVSDNQSSGLEGLNAKRVQELAVPHTQALLRFAMGLEKLRRASQITLQHGVDLSQLRATHSQAQQAEQLLQKALVLNVLDDALQQQIYQSADIKQVLGILTQATQMHAPSIDSRSAAR